MYSCSCVCHVTVSIYTIRLAYSERIHVSAYIVMCVVFIKHIVYYYEYPMSITTVVLSHCQVYCVGMIRYKLQYVHTFMHVYVYSIATHM
jgi:hypothetical protein